MSCGNAAEAVTRVNYRRDGKLGQVNEAGEGILQQRNNRPNSKWL